VPKSGAFGQQNPLDLPWTGTRKRPPKSLPCGRAPA